MGIWGTAVLVTSILWTLAGIFLIYTACNLILHLDWKHFVFGVLLWTAVTLAQIAFSALAE